MSVTVQVYSLWNFASLCISQLFWRALDWRERRETETALLLVLVALSIVAPCLRLLPKPSLRRRRPSSMVWTVWTQSFRRSSTGLPTGSERGSTAHRCELQHADGDRAAARIAAALGADRLVILSNVPGLLRDPADESTLIATIDRARMDEAEDFAAGRMKKKTMGAAEALDAGVAEVILADARVADPLDRALRHEGTVIR